MRKNTNLKTNRILKIVLLISIFSSLIYLNRNVLIYRNLINYLETKQIEAVIINEKKIHEAFSFYRQVYLLL